MLKHVVTRSVADTSGKMVLSKAEEISADSEHNYDGQVANPSDNQIVSWSITQSLLRYVAISSDRDITIHTNNPSAPQDTVNIKGGQVFLWTLGMDGPAKIPFAGNVTALYITNTSGHVANVKIRALAHVGQ